MPSAPAPVASKKGNKASVEAVYQKKTQLEHILLRPDTYIGMWNWNIYIVNENYPGVNDTTSKTKN